MFHIRIDDEPENSKRKFACGLGPELPAGDMYFFEAEVAMWPQRMNRIDCPGCNPDGPKPLGTPISELSGRPDHPGYGEFVRISQSWGYP